MLLNSNGCSYNYGQFLTIWDRIGGSFRGPDPEWFNKRQEPKERGMRGVKLS